MRSLPVGARRRESGGQLAAVGGNWQTTGKADRPAGLTRRTRGKKREGTKDVAPKRRQPQREARPSYSYGRLPLPCSRSLASSRVRCKLLYSNPHSLIQPLQTWPLTTTNEHCMGMAWAWHCMVHHRPSKRKRTILTRTQQLTSRTDMSVLMPANAVPHPRLTPQTQAPKQTKHQTHQCNTNQTCARRYF